MSRHYRVVANILDPRLWWRLEQQRRMRDAVTTTIKAINEFVEVFNAFGKKLDNGETR